MTTWLDTAGAANYLRRNPHEVRRGAAAGTIPAHKFGKQWRFDPVELDALIRGVDAGHRPVLSARSRRRRRAS